MSRSNWRGVGQGRMSTSDVERPEAGRSGVSMEEEEKRPDTSGGSATGGVGGGMRSLRKRLSTLALGKKSSQGVLGREVVEEDGKEF
jgi:hypothetical protein